MKSDQSLSDSVGILRCCSARIAQVALKTSVSIINAAKEETAREINVLCSPKIAAFPLGRTVLQFHQDRHNLAEVLINGVTFHVGTGPYFFGNPTYQALTT